MSLSEKLSNWFNGVPEEEYYEKVTDSKQAVSTNTDVNRASEPEKDNNRQVMSLMSSKNNSTTVQREQKIMVFDPSVFSDVKNIGKMILNGRAVIVNFRKMDENQIHRVIDFLSGLIFAVNGDMQRIGEKIFLCTPKNFKIEGDLSNLTGR
ncbi:cell division protein SepF [Ligilactobacillus salivarius]|uniref:cell division protein SepF n=1 Tax=Ligilactobacillus salivarius TaxID=1624 RepID=UPI000A2E00AB|nr:cell division protein SepF [Ligilactobacillus salivarius]MDM8284170.1 cell division protein SepF [Ligilactobacillus salivarius]MYU96259.1 cell division protein SepF [Ligilactobacillus salivarius]NME23985.1 cell division protein SepF [Ligilactobacillus salivarius]OTF93460.1 cell division protein SepF [Ligilactobacillus salivarius]PAY43987.1 cell division protein SepF [Ligilactobacillus salivarius]